MHGPFQLKIALCLLNHMRAGNQLKPFAAKSIKQKARRTATICC